jgi:hypothetical protein
MPENGIGSMASTSECPYVAASKTKKPTVTVLAAMMDLSTGRGVSTLYKETVSIHEVTHKII